jgi:hypothetical protein
MSNFDFLQSDFNAIFCLAVLAESNVYSDPTNSALKAWVTLEKILNWIDENDSSISFKSKTLGEKIQEHSFVSKAGIEIYSKCAVIKSIGGKGTLPSGIRVKEALGCIEELFHVCHWFACSYSANIQPNSAKNFNPNLIPPKLLSQQSVINKLPKLDDDLIKKQPVQRKSNSYNNLWEDWIRRLTNYKKKYGNLLISTNYITGDGYKLGQWVLTQRASKLKLTAERFKQLDAIDGWTWTANEANWDLQFEKLKAYEQEYGNCKLPYDWSVHDRYIKLRSWVSKQRVSKSKLSQSQIEKLESLNGWSWFEK